MSGLGEWVVGVVEQLGYAGLVVLVALENLIPPIPSELILPLAGFLAGQGRLSLPLVIVAATLGSVGGALVLYAFGRSLGRERLDRVVRRYGRFVLIDGSDVDRAMDLFARHGRAAVLIGRLLPGARSLISVPAGLARMPLLSFIFFTAVGSAAWNSLLIGFGWVVGERWRELQPIAQAFEWLIIGAAGIVVAVFVIRRARR